MQKEIDVTVPFDTIKKIYPDGSVTLKKLKFTGYKIQRGYESETDEERLARHDYQKNKKHKDTYASVVMDWRDKQYIRLHGVQGTVDCDADAQGDTDTIVQSQPISDDERAAEIERKRKNKVLYNIAKTRNKIFDIARSNDFNYFITLTYNADKCDRYSFSDCSKKVRQFMNNFSKRNKDTCPNFKYLLVHEQHKDGAYHYHGLIYLEHEDFLVYDPVRSKQYARAHHGQKLDIYNWCKWRNGWSTVSKIDNQDACRKYILKYISKNIDEDYQKGQRHFYYSQNCLKPEVESMVSDKQMLMMYDQVYETDRSIGYESTLDNLDEMAGMIAELRYGLDGDDL